jgi:hypothetical protein
MRRKIKPETKKKQKKTKKTCFALSVLIFCVTLWSGNAQRMPDAVKTASQVFRVSASKTSIAHEVIDCVRMR